MEDGREEELSSPRDGPAGIDMYLEKLVLRKAALEKLRQNMIKKKKNYTGNFRNRSKLDN